MNEKLTPAQERELLELQAMLARLKIQAAQVQTKQRRRHEKISTHTMLGLANSANHIMKNHGVFKIAMLPQKWKYRLLLGGALMAWEWYRTQKLNQPYHSKIQDDDIIDVYPDNKQIKHQ